MTILSKKSQQNIIKPVITPHLLDTVFMMHFQQFYTCLQTATHPHCQEAWVSQL